MQDLPKQEKPEVSHKIKSTLPKPTRKEMDTKFAYRQQNKLVSVAANAAINHVELAKRNRKDNQQKK